MSGPTLSVVMPNYNHSRHLAEAIEGVLHQTRLPDEFLILDDASTDNSLEIIESYAEKHPVIRVLKNSQNTGVVEAHRRLFEAAQGDYVCTAPADDAHLPRYCELGMQLAKKYPHAGIIFGKIRVIDEHNAILAELGVRRWPQSRYATPQEFLTEYLDVEAPSHSLCGATIYRRQAFREVDWYRSELGHWSDTFAARAIGLAYGVCYISEPVYVWRKLATGFSAESRVDARHTLDTVARAAALMRSPEFRDRFPEEHVRRWERRYRRLVVWNSWQGEGTAFQPTTARFWWNSFKRLPKLPRAIRLGVFHSPRKGDSGA